VEWWEKSLLLRRGENDSIWWEVGEDSLNWVEVRGDWKGV